MFEGVLAILSIAALGPGLCINMFLLCMFSICAPPSFGGQVRLLLQCCNCSWDFSLLFAAILLSLVAPLMSENFWGVEYGWVTWREAELANHSLICLPVLLNNSLGEWVAALSSFSTLFVWRLEDFFNGILLLLRGLSFVLVLWRLAAIGAYYRSGRYRWQLLLRLICRLLRILAQIERLYCAGYIIIKYDVFKTCWLCNK